VPTLRLTTIALSITERRHRLRALSSNRAASGNILFISGEAWFSPLRRVYPLVSNLQAERAVLAATIDWLPPYVMLRRRFTKIVLDGGPNISVQQARREALRGWGVNDGARRASDVDGGMAQCGIRCVWRTPKNSDHSGGEQLE
jgi:hypothetical protein